MRDGWMSHMHWNMFGPLSLLLAFRLVLAGGSALSPEPAWLGREVRIQATSFCFEHGCIQTAVRRNTESNMGWQDGQQLTYRLRGGAELNLDVRVANTPPGRGRWVSNARLSLPNARKQTSAADLRLAADFYGALTGRRFTPAAVADCRRRAEADPDIETGNMLLSNGRTPAGLPYRARCGKARNHTKAWPLFWVGWMQQ